MARKIKKTINTLSVLIILIILGLMVYGIMNIEAIDGTASSTINNYGIPALFIVSVFLDIVPQIISPIFALGAGIIAGINIYYAILATILGSTLGAIIGFVIGKKYMFEAVDILSSKKSINKLTYLTNKYGKIVIPIAAISPLPYLPVAIGAMNLSRRNFVIYGLIPRALGIIAYGAFFGLL